MENAKLCRRITKAGFSKIDSGDDNLNSFLKYFEDRSYMSYMIVTVYHDGTIEVQRAGTIVTTIYAPNEQELFLSTIEDREYKRILVFLITTGLLLGLYLIQKLLG
jgi:hypothetical protein